MSKQPTIVKGGKSKRNPATTTTVFIVDDEAAMRESLTFLMESAGLSAASYESAEAFLAEYDPRRAGCLLLDVRMRGMTGVELHEQHLQDTLAVPVIVVTAHADVPMAVRAMKNGAFDFFEKPFDDQVLLDSIQAAIMQDREARRRHETVASVLARYDTLSPREREVMAHVVDGYMNKQIAQLLDVASKTVETHRAKLMSKMEADSIVALVRMATVIEQARGEGP